MTIPKKYVRDHVILLLLSANAFLVIALAIFVPVRLSAGHGNGYIVQYRSALGIDAFKQGGVSDILSFILFGLLILGISTVLSLKTYHIHRQVAIAVLAMTTLLLVLAIVISNALLVLH